MLNYTLGPSTPWPFTWYANAYMLTEVRPTKGQPRKKKHHLSRPLYSVINQQLLMSGTNEEDRLRKPRCYPSQCPEGTHAKVHCAEPTGAERTCFVVVDRSLHNELTWTGLRQGESCVLAYLVEKPVRSSPTDQKYLPSNRNTEMIP